MSRARRQSIRLPRVDWKRNEMPSLEVGRHQEPRSPCRREACCGITASLQPQCDFHTSAPDGTTFGRRILKVGLPDSSGVPNKLFQRERGTTEQLLGLWTEVASQPEAHNTGKGKHHPDICGWLPAPAHALPEGQRRGIGIHELRRRVARSVGLFCAFNQIRRQRQAGVRASAHARPTLPGWGAYRPLVRPAAPRRRTPASSTSA